MGELRKLSKRLCHDHALAQAPWAIGSRKSLALKAAVLDGAAWLAASPDATAGWNGKDAILQLSKAKKTVQAG